MSDTFTWEGDDDSSAGMATYYFIGGSCSVRLRSFVDAHALARAIALERVNVGMEARDALFREIQRLRAP